MAIRKERFGAMPDGREISLYTITNANGLSASVTDLGAVWVTMFAPDRHGNMADVVLGFDDTAGYLARGPHFGAVVGRVANRTAGGKFKIDGTEYTLAQNNGLNNLHSGPDYYEKRLWEAAQGSDERSVMFTLVSPDCDQGFPGTVTVSVIYRLTDDNCMEITYHAVTDRTTPMNPTNHSYFNLAGHDGGSVLKQRVQIVAGLYTPCDEGLIPTGEILKVEGTPMDFREEKEIGAGIDADFVQLKQAGGYDHNWCLDHAAGEYDLAARAYDPESGRAMDVYTDLPGVQFYTSNSLHVECGKNGTAYGPRGAYCFETQFYPDSLNKPHFPSPILHPGEVYTSKTGYRFYVR